jgi:hypothetical protein
MSRWRAAAIHLSISILIGLLVLALLFLVWYPQPYFHAAGGQQLIIVLLGVDLVLGPLLTLILFKSGKKGMLFDLCMIAAFQISALIYGLVVIAEARPVFIVAVVDRFNLVSAADIDPEDLAKGKKPEFRSLSWTGPRLIGAQVPPPGKERTDLMFKTAPGGKDVQNFPKYYVDYASVSAGLLEHSKPLAELRKRQPDSAPVLDAWLREHAARDEAVTWVPVLARKSSVVMLLDARSGEVLDALPIYPW